MKQPRSIYLTVVLALATALVPAFAQGTPEGDEEDVPKGGFILEIGTWVAQPTGVDLEPGTLLDSTNPFGTTPLTYGDSTKAELYYKFGYQLPKDHGRFIVWLYENNQDDLQQAASTPGIYQFGETLVNPLFAGVNLNGVADAYDSTAAVTLKDFRFDYYRTAFNNSRVKGEWFIGWRRTEFDRSLSANYYALIPGFPPLLPPLSPPISGLDPGVDSASMSSSFEGRGLSGGMNFEIPLLPNRLKLEAGFGYSALRGDMATQYSSTTNYYVLPTNEGDLLLSAPYSAFGETVFTPADDGTTVPLASMVRQRTLKTGLQSAGRSTSASVIDLNLELRWRAWKQLEVVFGFRNTRYDDVASDVRTTTGITPLGSNNITVELENSSGNMIQLTSPTLLFNVQGETETKRSVTYEGFYFGLGYTF